MTARRASRPDSRPGGHDRARHRRFFGIAIALLTTSLWRAAAADPLAPIGIEPPPLAPVRPVTETLYGTTIVDPYRYFEAMGPETIAWMQAQGAYTRAVFDAIAPRAALLERISTFVGAFGFIEGYAHFGERTFYESRGPGTDDFDLIVADARGRRTLVDIAALRASHGGAAYAINYFSASPDGTKVAAGISAGGSEATLLYVYDAATGAVLAGPIDRTDSGVSGWSGDSKTLYYVRLKALAPGEPETDKYLDSSVYALDVDARDTGAHEAHDGVPILGAAAPKNVAGAALQFEPIETPIVDIAPNATAVVALAINGVQNEVRAWIAPAAAFAAGRAMWRPLLTRADGVTGLALRGDDVFLLSHRDAPNFAVLLLRADETLADARTLVPGDARRVIESIHAAADALYVLARDGTYSRLLRIPTGTSTVSEVPLPFAGYASDAFTDPRVPGITLTLESWVTPPRIVAYSPAQSRFDDLGLGSAPPIDASAFVISDLEAVASDGTHVPLTLLRPNHVVGNSPTLLEAYGSYGISSLPYFSPRVVALLREGATHATCHVRGGGELGETWRLAGKDANKPNTWRDLIACAEDLVERGVATKSTLFIEGGSAGGIAVGMAMVERPDLFAGVVDGVPVSNPTRSEFSPNGPPNVPEFGSVATPSGFANLYAMDPYLHVRDGVAYPAVLITTGLNDPRVSSWEPAKLAARLQASRTADGNPVLLRIETDAGHGIGSTRAQQDALAADTFSFMFWRAGQPGWRPKAR